ncbi:MAG: tRNA U34 5-carboxymethylaminomethyl modifying GTPase MnmE/TrmE [Psychromonas sp.]|jgi:tRNA U34 5-carboxymethylaminomethyl modifying GTPase MnmE/TrmE
MDLFAQLLMIIIPAGIVFYTTQLFLKKQGEKEKQNILGELKKERQAYFLPNRADAYQRVVLLMERIHPNSLVMRIHNPAMKAAGFQAELLKAVREEFDHNVAQQLFVSPEAWTMCKNAKDETVKIINIAAQKVGSDAMATELASAIFEIVGEIGELPTEIALAFLKVEFQRLF